MSTAGRAGDKATGARLDPGRGLAEEMVALPDGRILRAVTAGSGPGPLVVFESGLTAGASAWLPVQRAVTATARTLSYDRAGYGGSTRDRHRRTLPRMASDLADLLDARDEGGPVVLVAHSWGGPVVRAFAAAHPHRVAGVVLVDATVSATMTEREATSTHWAMAVLRSAQPLGLARRFMLAQLGLDPSADVDPEDLEVMLRDVGSRACCRAAVQEARELRSALPLMRRWEGTLPPVPVLAVQGGRSERRTARSRRDFNAAVRAEMQTHPCGRYVEIAAAGHLVPQEQPTALADLVRGLVRRVIDPRQQEQDTAAPRRGEP